MTIDEIIRMAREAGAHELFRLDGAQDSGIGLTGNESIIRFAEMVAEAERVTRIAAQCEADDLKERLARSGVEQRRAVRAEREACAKVCDAQAESHELLSNTQAVKGCDDCATAIRARGSNVP